MFLITGIKCYLDRTKRRLMSGSILRGSFPEVLQATSGWRAVPVQGRAGQGRQGRAGRQTCTGSRQLGFVPL